jgi:hypothetical protein
VFGSLVSVCMSCSSYGTGDVDKGGTDSGGPGTYSQLLIIKEYMVRLAIDLGVDESEVYPADYFDLMGGVGFGGYANYIYRTQISSPLQTRGHFARAPPNERRRSH